MAAISVASREPLPRDAEQRLDKFTELVATAVANATSREALRRLADEQAALRRVATLVAEGARRPPCSMPWRRRAGLLHADGLSVCRYEEGGQLTIVAHQGAQAQQLPPGRIIRHDDPDSITATVRRTGRPARIDSYGRTQGRTGELHRPSAIQAPASAFRSSSTAGCGASPWRAGRSEYPPSDTEQRMAQFGELLAHRDRQRRQPRPAHRVTRAPADRRPTTHAGGVVRDLHDGAQQRLVHTIVTLKLARAGLSRGEERCRRSLVDEALVHAEPATRSCASSRTGSMPRAAHPRRAAQRVSGARRRAPRPARRPSTWPANGCRRTIEASAYFVVAEALTNVVKHSQAGHATVTASALEGTLDVRIR